ncbi:MAG: hypothetical protein AAGC57_17425, partial [Pseudomonadota bacterium]
MAQHPIALRRGVGDVPAADDVARRRARSVVPTVDAGMALVAEDRDRDASLAGAVGTLKGYVKRGKSDALDAEAICEAVQRPSMRSGPISPSWGWSPIPASLTL